MNWDTRTYGRVAWRATTETTTAHWLKGNIELELGFGPGWADSREPHDCKAALLHVARDGPGVDVGSIGRACCTNTASPPRTAPQRTDTLIQLQEETSPAIGLPLMSLVKLGHIRT